MDDVGPLKIFGKRLLKRKIAIFFGQGAKALRASRFKNGSRVPVQELGTAKLEPKVASLGTGRPAFNYFKSTILELGLSCLDIL